jgi:large subunit ribosomal protein L28
MARVCQVTKRGPSTGNNISHSNRKTKRRFMINLIKKRVYLESTGTFKVFKMSARAWRSFAKHGEAYLKKMTKKHSA